MDVFTMVAIIVSVSCAAGVANQYFRNRAKGAGKPDPAVQRDVDELRKRVEVLEQIVTDEKYELAKEFDRLDGRENPKGSA